MVTSLLEKTVAPVFKSSGTKYREDGGSKFLSAFFTFVIVYTFIEIG
jgi:hypothetical protein